MAISNIPRSDALPEFIHYKDKGCELQSHCLTCPLVVCKEELSQGARPVRAHLRGLRVALLRSEGYTVKWIAQVMGISVRTVIRLSNSESDDMSTLTDSVRRATINVVATTVASNGR